MRYVSANLFNQQEFSHHIDDSLYMEMISNNSLGEMNKSVTIGQIFEIDSIASTNDNMVIVTGETCPAVSIKINKEKDFLKSLGLDISSFIDHVKNGNKQSIKIISTDGGLVGSFTEAQKDSIFDDFFSQIDLQNKVYDAKVLQKNRGGYFVDINGVEAFLPGSLASANKITNFEALIGKTIKVMIDSFINASNTFIVSNKKYIDYIMPKMIEDLDIRNRYIGIVTGTIEAGAFIEFNGIMTGLLSVNDMDEQTKQNFSAKLLRPGTELNIWVRDVIPPKNFVLTQKEEIINQTYDQLLHLKNLIESEDKNVAVEVTIESIRGSHVTIKFGSLTTTVPIKSIVSSQQRIKSGDKIFIVITDANEKRNLIQATTYTENEP